jgi:hypothetical protein
VRRRIGPLVLSNSEEEDSDGNIIHVIDVADIGKKKP